MQQIFFLINPDVWILKSQEINPLGRYLFDDLIKVLDLDPFLYLKPVQRVAFDLMKDASVYLSAEAFNAFSARDATDDALGVFCSRVWRDGHHVFEPPVCFYCLAGVLYVMGFFHAGKYSLVLVLVGLT